ncbi:MAG: hypothetical protein ACLGIF_09120 [Actinomycetes bacterium]
MRTLRTTLGATVLALLLAGCSVAAPPETDVVVPDDPVTSAPPTGGPEPPPEEPVEEPAPSVSLPQLPVGGAGEFVDAEENLQCAAVSWIVEEDGPAALRKGIRIAITGAAVDPRVFALVEEGCEEKGESCLGYSFSADSDSPACLFAVATRRPLLGEVENTSLTVAGTVRCEAVEDWECAAFVEAARSGSGSIALAPPTPDAPTASPSETGGE